MAKNRPARFINQSLLKDFCGESIGEQERDYFDHHRRRYEETLSALERIRLKKEGSRRPRLLDVGGFPGHLAFAASRAGWNVEIVTEPLDKFPPYEAFRRACERRGLPVRTLDIEREFLPYDREQFDAVLFTEVLEHLAYNPFHALGEICRTLRPEGALILTTPNVASAGRIAALLHQHPIAPPLTAPWSELFPTAPTKRHVREYTAREVRHLLTEQNKDLYRFDRVEIGFMDSWREKEPLPGGMVGAAARLLRRLGGRWQGNIFATARKPAGLFLVRLGEVELLDGWYDIEPPFHPRNMPMESPYPVRWMSGRAEMRIPLTPLAKKALATACRVRVTLPFRNPLPADYVPVRSVRLSLAGGEEGEMQPVEYSPDMTPVSATFDLDSTTESLQIGITATTFRPDESVQPGDKRSLSVQLIESRLRIEVMT